MCRFYRLGVGAILLSFVELGAGKLQSPKSNRVRWARDVHEDSGQQYDLIRSLERSATTRANANDEREVTNLGNFGRMT
jgi:hypothetical protein